jgi:hypothetical protein
MAKRKALQRRDGERGRYRAKVERFGSKVGYKGYTENTLLLREVVDAQTGQQVTDHLWFTMTKRWESAGVTPGDVVEFDARVKSYRCGYWGHNIDKQIENPPRWDYKLSYPSKIEVIETS